MLGARYGVAPIGDRRPATTILLVLTAGGLTTCADDDEDARECTYGRTCDE